MFKQIIYCINKCYFSKEKIMQIHQTDNMFMLVVFLFKVNLIK